MANSELDGKIVNMVNNWYHGLNKIDKPEQDYVKYEISKNKFKKKYAARTGEFLKITQKLETLMFSKIQQGLSVNYVFSEPLLDEYLNWCFDNYDFFTKTYQSFTLNNIAAFSSQWKKDLFKFEFKTKTSFDDLKKINVSDNAIYNFEKFGLPFAATKLSEEKNVEKDKLSRVIEAKLQELTNTKNGLNSLKNIMRKTVENGPYEKDFMFYDYQKSLKKFFLYFTNEPWCEI